MASGLGELKMTEIEFWIANVGKMLTNVRPLPTYTISSGESVVETGGNYPPQLFLFHKYQFITNVITAYLLSLVVRKPAFCICENIDADHYREADQRLCFRYTDNSIPLLP